MNEYNITWAKRNNEELEYEIEELKYEIKELEQRNLKLIREKAIWEALYVLTTINLIINLIAVILSKLGEC